MLPVAVGCLQMMYDAVCAVMHGMMTKDVTSCGGVSTDAVGCNECSDAWHDDKE